MIGGVIKTIITFILIIHGIAGYCQITYELTINYFEDSINDAPVFPVEVLNADSLNLGPVINQRLQNLYELGFLAATYHVKQYADSTMEVSFFTDHVFDLVRLSQGNVGDEIINKIGFDTGSIINRPFSHHRLVRILDSILDYAENHGYPFASVKLDSITIVDREVGAWINYQSGPLILFDSLIVNGYDKVKSRYVMTHLGIYPGKPYEERLITEIPNKMRLLSFVSMTKSPEITISGGKCNIYLELSPTKASKLDGIVGVLPNQKDGEDLLITGQLNLDLYNLFSSGKRVALEWQSYDSRSQLLNVFYYHPNLLRTPINIQGDFNLLKQDTTFINREFAMELSLLSKRSMTFGFRSEFISSRLISTSGLENVMDLPENTDYNLNYYGLNYMVDRFDDINFPTRGWKVHLKGSVGQKKIIKNSVLDDDIYSGVDLNTIQYRITAGYESYLPVYKILQFRGKMIGGYLEGDHLFQSDLFRIGGLRTLRGFVENQFYVSTFAIATIEFRALVSQETYFQVFYDQGIVNNEFQVGSEIQYPFGTGAGFSFSTNAGIFNFVFAMGKSNDQPFQMDHAKIHFGYISRF